MLTPPGSLCPDQTPDPSPAPRTALTSPPQRLGLQAPVLRVTRAGSLLCVCSRLKPGFTCRAGRHQHPPTPAAGSPGPWATQFAHHHHPEGRAGLGTCATPSPAWHGVGQRGASVRGPGGRVLSCEGAGLGLSQGHFSSERAQPGQPIPHSLPPGKQGSGQVPPGQGCWAGQVGHRGHWSLPTSLSPLSARSSWLLASL